MEITDYILIQLVYAVMTLTTFFIEIRRIVKKGKIKARNFFNIYYIVVYFISPIACLSYKDSINYYFVNVNNNEHVKYFYMVLLFSIIGYISLNAGSKIKIELKYWTNKKISEKEDIYKNPRNLLKSAFIMLIIGWISLFLWTRAYGSLLGIFKYGSALRSGYIVIYNKYKAFQLLCPLNIIAFFIFYTFFLERKEHNKSFNAIIIISMIISFIGSYIYMIGNDGRMLMLIFILVMIFYYLDFKKIRITRKLLLMGGILFIGILVFLGTIDSITNYIRLNEKNIKINFEIRKIVATEFSFTYYNNLNLLYFKDKSIYTGSTEWKDIKAILLTFVSSKYKSNDYTDLYTFNTSFYPVIWQIPTDLLTASIYKFSYLGIVVLPIFVGFISNALEQFLEKRKSSYYRMIGYLLSIYLGLRFIAYYDLYRIIFGSIYIIANFLIVKCISCLKTNN